MDKETTKKKLILAVLQGDDYADTVDELNRGGFFATVLSSTGGFLKKKSTTVMIGVEEDRLEEALDVLQKYAGHRKETVYQSVTMPHGEMSAVPPVPMEVMAGGAAVFIVSLLSNLRLSLSIGGGYSVLAFTFSGLTFPVMAMWPAMRYLSKLFPFTYYTDIFVDQMLRGAPVACSLPDMGYMSLFIVLPLLCLPRLRTICTEEKYWGRL